LQCVEYNYTPREAYHAVPELQPRGDSVVQNIRKRAREQREKAAAAAAPSAATRQAAAKPPRAKRPTRPNAASLSQLRAATRHLRPPERLATIPGVLYMPEA